MRLSASLAGLVALTSSLNSNWLNEPNAQIDPERFSVVRLLFTNGHHRVWRIIICDQLAAMRRLRVYQIQISAFDDLRACL